MCQCNHCGSQKKEATELTAKTNKAFYSLLDFKDVREVECSKKGLIAAHESLEIKNEEGTVIWSQKAYEFLEYECPDTANPSLWRNIAICLRLA